MANPDFHYFENLLAQHILILDGAMGTMIQTFHLGEEDFNGESSLTPAEAKGLFSNWPVKLQGNNDLIALTRPDVLRSIHRQYLEAGTDIIECNTFNAQRISQADYHTEHYVVQMNQAAVRIAREEADRMTQLTPEKPRFVAASIGPTNRTLSMSPDVENPAYRAVSFDELCAAYEEQMLVLSQGGVDLFLLETIFDTLNTKAALVAARKVKQQTGRRIPIMLSVTIADASGRTLSGQTLEAFLASVQHDEDILSVGLNCSFGAEDMRPYLRTLSEKAPYFVSSHPNAGLPDEEGCYNETPAMMAEAISHFIDDGCVNIVGGCCGSTPDHIRAIAQIAEGRPPRERHSEKRVDWLSGLEGFSPVKGAFMIVGERCNVAGSRKFLRLINEKQYDEALGIARKQVRDGATLLDVNMDDGMLDASAEMTHFLNLMASDPEVARIPWMIDSSNFSVIEAALKCVQGKCVVNSISLKEGEEKFLAHARVIKEYGAAMVVMAFDEQGQAATYDHKIKVCERAYKLLTEQVGIAPRDIIFDPNVLTIATGMSEHNAYGLNFIRATEWIIKNLPEAHVSGGVSNLSFSFRGNNYLREAMHAVFLYQGMQRGMDMGIVNPASKVMYGDIPAPLLQVIEDAILDKDEAASERLIEQAEKLLAEKKNAPVTPGAAPSVDRSTIPLDERLMTALRTGDDEYLEPDLAEALQHYPVPGAIIEGPLMQGMQRVGDLFGEGKMFLPQVVKSARTMKKAVAILQPYLEQSKQSAERSNGRYLVATVKGDVHDIGKNIVAVVLGCNNFDVVDLGVMVPAEQVVQTVLEQHVDFVALSGLITPSLDEMCHTAEAMAKAGITVPLFIGGATTSELHTALKIAPLYNGPVFHVKDASQNPVLAIQLQGAQREQLIRENAAHQAELVRQYEAKKKAKQLLEQAAAPAQKNTLKGCPCGCDNPEHHHAPHRFVIDWEKEVLPQPTFVGYKSIPHISIAEVRPYINWIYFYNLWRVRSGTEEARRIQTEAEALLDEIEQRHSMQAQVGFYPAYGTPSSIVLPGAVNGTDLELPTPRQKHPAQQGNPCLSLCDFVAPRPYEDYVGVFAVTVSASFVEELESLKKAKDEYASLLLQSVGDRLAEATSEWLHREVRTRLWGYAPDEQLSLPDLARAAYQGIRPAIGYPSLPNQQLIFPVSRLLNFEALGITLTENGAMYPQSSTCGLYLSSPHARYFVVSNAEEKLG